MNSTVLTLQQLVALDLELAQRRAEAAAARHLAMWGRPPRHDLQQATVKAADPIRAVVVLWVTGWPAPGPELEPDPGRSDGR